MPSLAHHHGRRVEFLGGGDDDLGGGPVGGHKHGFDLEASVVADRQAALDKVLCFASPITGASIRPPAAACATPNDRSTGLWMYSSLARRLVPRILGAT
jgi:hypothetical protein